MEHPWATLFVIFFLVLLSGQAYAVFNPHSPLAAVFPIGIVSVFYPNNIVGALGWIILESLLVSFALVFIIVSARRKLKTIFA